MAMLYNDPINNNPSTIGDNLNVRVLDKKVLIDLAPKRYFSNMASVKNMPKNYGKTWSVSHMLPILDDRNVNDQGIDANGATIANGNLYGSSRDIGTITGSLPSLTEEGGRVNRVGMTRLIIEGSLQQFGFFMEYTQQSLDFDSDAGLYSHFSREMLTAAATIYEQVLARDLILNAGVVAYAGGATTLATVSAEGATPDIVNYEIIESVLAALKANNAPSGTTIIKGSTLNDTRTVGRGRFAYVSPEVSALLRVVEDPFQRPAFIPVEQYAAAGDIVEGEIGSIAGMRFIEVDDMLYHAGAGATASGAAPQYGTTEVAGVDKYDVHNILVVAGNAFATIGFQQSGNTPKFALRVNKPGDESTNRDNPYGSVGLASLQWFYGFLPLRSEWIAVIRTVGLGQ